ncbi:hypothetical protein BDW42DRAFT_170184 [Aspergillus taichungensis]|uniref:Uncharacterized protein n=1 Tax=Aspergillus taichungensis TaxID=482145 RepID=A0A2J5HTW6_9EURO|nr:hypothetical protein BDW42DRAFT_170184 [Aspergillus taichungensis]
MEKFTDIRRCIMEVKLFDKPMGSQGSCYAKPCDYLAIALVESPMTIDNIRVQIDGLIRRKSYSI